MAGGWVFSVQLYRSHYISESIFLWFYTYYICCLNTLKIETLCHHDIIHGWKQQVEMHMFTIKEKAHIFWMNVNTRMYAYYLCVVLNTVIGTYCWHVCKYILALFEHLCTYTQHYFFHYFCIFICIYNNV